MKKKLIDQPIKKLKELPPTQFISTGIEEIDEILGGYPRGKISMIYGMSSVGKTTMMLRCLSTIKDVKILYCDVENALDMGRVKELGADSDNISYTTSSVLEEVTVLVRNNLKHFDLIIIDSIAMLTPRQEHSTETGDFSGVGLKPRLLGQWLRQITKDLADSNCALVFVNQVRRSMEMYGEKWVVPGGMQLKFSASVMLELTTTSKDRIIKDGKRTGHWVNVTVKKSKVSSPHVSTKFRLTY